MSQAEKPKIVVQDVLQMLKDGKTREDIRQHYGLKKTDLKRLFKHPKLTGKKTHAKPAFVVVDEEEEANAAPQSENTNDEVADEAPAQDFRNPESQSQEDEDLNVRETFGS